MFTVACVVLICDFVILVGNAFAILLWFMVLWFGFLYVCVLLVLICCVGLIASLLMFGFPLWGLIDYCLQGRTLLVFLGLLFCTCFGVGFCFARLGWFGVIAMRLLFTAWCVCFVVWVWVGLWCFRWFVWCFASYLYLVLFMFADGVFSVYYVLLIDYLYVICVSDWRLCYCWFLSVGLFVFAVVAFVLFYIGINFMVLIVVKIIIQVLCYY